MTVTGNPDPKHVRTSYAERQNLTMRMQMRPFTRLTNAFSKKVANQEAAVALHFMHTTSSESTRRFGSRPDGGRRHRSAVVDRGYRRASGLSKIIRTAEVAALLRLYCTWQPFRSKRP
jgi:hypothetical protein